MLRRILFLGYDFICDCFKGQDLYTQDLISIPLIVLSVFFFLSLDPHQEWNVRTVNCDRLITSFAMSTSHDRIEHRSVLI